MLNIMRLVTDQVFAMRHRGQSHWPAAADVAGAPAGGGPALAVARLKYPGNCDPEPLALERFRRVMAARENARVEIVGPIAIEDLPKHPVRLAHLGGTGAFALTVAEVAVLRKFVADGGTLLLEAVGGDETFARQAQQYLEALCPGKKLADLPPDSQLFTLDGNQIKSVTYGRRTLQRVGRTAPTPMIKAVFFDNQPRIYLSREDITTGLLGCPYFTVDGYSGRSAYYLFRNILLLSHQKP